MNLNTHEQTALDINTALGRYGFELSADTIEALANELPALNTQDEAADFLSALANALQQVAEDIRYS